MTTLSALICAKNEQDFVGICLSHLEPFVDEIIFVDNGSTDRTKEIAKQFSKVKLFDFPPEEPVDMGKVRNFSLSKATGDWYLQVDCDEIYPEESMRRIRNAIKNTDAYSFRVKYYNLAWRSGYVQKEFGHYPDRLYKRKVVEGYKGVLPRDMTYVKREYLRAPNKPRGDIGVLEYDNNEDRSFEHPKQPILDVYYYHLARTRGYWYEYTKWKRYNQFTNPALSRNEIDHLTRINQWVSGLYEMEVKDIPHSIPKQTIPNPKVSVIITTFNYAHFVAQAIESVLNQTVKPFEIIVVDDYSRDGTQSILNNYAEKITVVSRDHNGGPGAARNDGISRSIGDYFLLLDADDRLKPNAIEELLKGIGENEVCYPDMEMFGEKEGVRAGLWKMPDYTPERMLEAQCIPSVCALVDRHAFDCAGGFNHQTLYEDYYFWLTLSHSLGLRFQHIPVPLLEYRLQKTSRSDFCNANRDTARAFFKKTFPIKW